jgi:hypothetical protein
MKSLALFIALLFALVIGWLAWNSRAANAPLANTTAPAASPRAPKAEERAPALVSATSRAELESASHEHSAAPAPAPASAPVDSAEILVRGSVRDERGILVPSGALDWIDELGVRRSARITDGSYSLPGLLAGQYLVMAVTSKRCEDQTDVTVNSTPAIQQRDFTIHPRPEIPIRIVSDDGTALIGLDSERKPLPGNLLRVRASRTPPSGLLDPSALLLQARTDCAGFGTRWDYGLPSGTSPDCLGILVLDRPPPLFVSLVYGNAVVATQHIDEVPEEIVFRLRADSLISRRAGVRLRVLDSDGKTPITQGNALLYAGTSIARHTDAEGRVEFLDLLPGGYDLTLEALGHTQRPCRSIVLEPGQVLELGDIALVQRPKQSIRCTFTSQTQPPVQFSVKREYPRDPLRTLGPLDNKLNSTRSSNPVDIVLPEAGTYELRVVEVGERGGDESMHLGARPLRVVFGDEPSNEIVVRVEPTTEICLRPPRASSGYSWWLVSTSDGLPCQRARTEGRARTRIELVPGEYTIARIDRETNSLGKPQALTVGVSFLTLELVP